MVHWRVRSQDTKRNRRCHVKLPVSISGLDRFDIAIETHDTIVSEGPNPIIGLWSDSRAVSVWSPGPCESLEACLGMGFSFLRNCCKKCWRGILRLAAAAVEFQAWEGTPPRNIWQAVPRGKFPVISFQRLVSGSSRPKSPVCSS